MALFYNQNLMFKMKKPIIFLLLFFISILSSCTEEILISELKTDKIPDKEKTVLSRQEAEKKFSEILSKATFNESELRTFLKNQALQRKDNDCNVFYPLTKNEIIAGNKSFKEILQQYASNDEVLNDIEKAAPLLNIFIPNLTLFDSNLSVENLNVKDTDIPIFNAGKFYWNGMVIDSICEEDGQALPIFHTFVINESHRRKIKNTTTRFSDIEIEYDFADEIYNPEIFKLKTLSTTRRTAQISYKKEVLPELLDPNNNYVPINEFPSETLEAFYKSGAGNGVLRSMMYYNLDEIEDLNSDDICLDYRVRDVIYRMKIDPSAYSYISNKNFQSPFIKNNRASYKGNRGVPSFNEIIRRLWSDGYYYFKINVINGNYNSQLMTIGLSPQDLFSVTLKEQFKHKTWFRKRQYKWWITEGDLGSKWIYPHKLNIDTRLCDWNPMRESYVRTIFISMAGVDATKKEIEVPNTLLKKWGINIPITTSRTGEKSVNITSDWENQYTNNTTSRVPVYVIDKDKGMEINNYSFFGSTPIVSVRNNKVYLKTQRFGCFDICIIPIKRNIQGNL